MRIDPYEKTAGRYDAFVEPFNRALRQIGLKLYPPRPGMAVLDVGCGTGTTLKLYQEAGCIVHGIDASPAMLTIAKDKLSARAELILGDASRMDYPGDTFDLVIGMLTLHEMPPAVRQAALGEMNRVLRTDGRLLIIDFHPGVVQFPKGWLFKAVVYFFEIMAGCEHYKNFRNFMSLDGICGLIAPHQLRIETKKIVGGGNLGIYVLCLPSSAAI